MAGFIKFQDFVDGVTVHEQVDEVTGLSSTWCIDPKQRGSRARTCVRSCASSNAKGKEVNFAEHRHPGACTRCRRARSSACRTARKVGVGDVIARIPQESSKTRDITGGLPRVADLFEARKPKDPAILAEVSGIVSFGKDTKGKQRLIITDDRRRRARGADPEVAPAQRVRRRARGDAARSSPTASRTRTTSCACRASSRWPTTWSSEIQDVYRLQGVKINDKHIEVIIRQMLRKVEIADIGDTRVPPRRAGSTASRVIEENERAAARRTSCRRRCEPVLLGITKASLATESFISAASFQETTRVLTEAAVRGTRDDLRGLKENVIVGRLIPAGTGLAYHTQRRRKASGLTESEMEALTRLGDGRVESATSDERRRALG